MTRIHSNEIEWAHSYQIRGKIHLVTRHTHYGVRNVVASERTLFWTDRLKLRV